jgi:hypothetical protein
MRATLIHEGQAFAVEASLDDSIAVKCLACGYESPDSSLPLEEIRRHWAKCPENINRPLGAPEPG